MGRWSNYPDIIEETKCLSIKELKGYGYLQKGRQVSGVISWTSGSSIRVSTYSELRMDLSYKLSRSSEEVKYSVRLILRPSNLGKGEILFFVCPKTLEACRKLYLPSGQKYFLSRKAFPKFYYDSQLANKRLRVFDKMFRYERKVEEVCKKGFRPYYKGQKTRKQKMIEAYQNRGFTSSDVRDLAMLK